MIEGVLKLMSSAVTWLILLGILVWAFGPKPEPCPRHICFPPEEVETVQQMMASDPDRFDPTKREQRRIEAFERNKKAAAEVRK